MRDQPVLDAVHSRMQVRPVVQEHALLLAVAVPADVDDHLSRHARGHQRAVRLLDQRQRHVDSGRDARAGDDSTVLHEQPVVDDTGPRVLALEARGDLPVRRARASVEQPGAAQDEGAAADGCQPRAGLVRAAQPGGRDVLAQAVERSRLGPGEEHQVAGPRLGQRLRSASLSPCSEVTDGSEPT